MEFTFNSNNTDVKTLHRSISQLIIANIGEENNMTSIELGSANHGANTNTDDDEGSVSEEQTDNHNKSLGSLCFPDLHQFSLGDSEFDEALAVPDSITLLSITDGDKAVVIEKKVEENDNGDDGTASTSSVEIPITALYSLPIKFTSISRKIFISDLEVLVKIVHTERSITTHFLNPNLYTIEFTHGEFRWQIKKRYKHFHILHLQLKKFRATLNFPFPTKAHREKRETIRKNFPNSKSVENINSNDPGANGAGKKKKRKLPRFPNKPESLITTVESLQNRIKQLEEYLYNLLNINLYRNHYETLNFLQVSNVSFVSGLGIKGKEGTILKRTGSTRPGQSGCNCCGCFGGRCCIRCNYFCSDVLCGKWRSRWFFVKETCFGYIRPSDGEIRSVVLFDQGFDVSQGIYHTGLRRGLQILTNNRQMIIKCWTRRQAKEWMEYLKMNAKTYARDFTYPNPHMSFAPQRACIRAKWFVDGSNYMMAVADALENAKEEIYIADWWLSPEIYMRRPAIEGDYWRLDKILQRKAEKGVRIFVLLYKEVEMALGINSYYSKQRLVNLHENIKVIRHPDHAKAGVLFWAHHEKIVVVDQTYAFLGGIDLCYGRWDDHRHRLTDLGSISSTGSSKANNSNGYFDETDLAIGSQGSRNINIELQESERQKKLPALHPGERLFMPSNYTSDSLAEHVKQNTPEMERKKVFIDKFKDNLVDNMKKGKDIVVQRLTSVVEPSHQLTNLDDRQKRDKQMLFSQGEMDEGKKGGIEDPTPHQTKIQADYYGQAKYWFGKDYTNFIMKDFVYLDAPLQDFIDRTTTPRMPWHDIGMMVIGSPARDIARHFIQRWNATKLEKTRDNQSFPYLMPKSYTEIRIDDTFLNNLSQIQRVSCQLLRSVSSWSCGFMEEDLVEQSIHDAYVQTITKAQHYIYIENQFFITLQLATTTGANSGVRNQIGEALFNRIMRAYKERKIFRVYVIMPLLPGFEGDVGGQTGTALRAITHWNYASISRGKCSIIGRLLEAGIEDPSEYICFFSLRNHSVLKDSPITELIYVHSKLLIADDKVVICGSANINDRSLIGKRDSEVAVIIMDEEFEDGQMNGAKYPSGVFAGKLRKYLFREHLGLLEPDPNRMPIDVTDPVIDGFWNGKWKRISHKNTEIYDEVFKCIPTNNVRTFTSLQRYQEEPGILKTDPELAFTRINQIQGFLVQLPLEFLSSEKLTPPGTTKEGLMPTSLWT